MIKGAETMVRTQDRSLRSLVDVERGMVNREVYVNEDIYKQELEQIFLRAWLFVGHESMVPNPGDFAASWWVNTNSAASASTKN